MTLETSSIAELEASDLGNAEIAACLQITQEYITSLSQQLPKNPSRGQLQRVEVLGDWRSYLESLCGHNLPKKDAVIVSQCTAALLELVLVDEISPGANQREVDKEGVPFRTRYARSAYKDIRIGSDTFKTSQFFPLEEIDSMFTNLESEEDVIAIKSLEMIGQIDVRMDMRVTLLFPQLFGSRQKFETFIKEYQKYVEDHGIPPNISLLCRVQLTDKLGLVVSLNRYGVQQSMFQTHERRGISFNPSPLSVSTLHQAIIELKTREILQEKTLPETTNTPTQQSVNPQRQLLQLLTNYSGIETWQRATLYKKMLMMQRIQSDSQTDSDIERIQTTYYQRLMDDENRIGDVNLLLTRSGVSANTTALIAAKEIILNTAKKIRVRVVPGWYYENNPPKTWQKVAVDDANLLLLGIEPNEPQMQIDDYASFAQAEITTFFSQAIKWPERTFVIILDRTSNLFDETPFSIATVPTNVVIFETASLTKQQRGGKYYFFGLVKSHNNPCTRAQMTKFRTEAMGTPTTDSLFALPRLRKSEIRSQIQHNLDLGKTIKDTFEEVQSGLPPESRWRIKIYNYYCFIFPPQKCILRAREGQRAYFPFVNGAILKEMFDAFFAAQPKDKSTFEKGDSFGLNTTRVVPFRLGSDKDNVLTQTVRRISFGRKTIRPEVKSFASFAATFLRDRTVILTSST